MAIYAENIVKQAESWLGRKESDGSHKAIIDVYNGRKPLARGYRVKYSDSWCATFVSAVAIAQNATNIIPTECSCGYMIKLFQSIGCWVENENRTPAPGDIIFYDWDDNGVGDNTGWPEHVGIVQKVISGVIHVIEGNYGDAVKVRKIAVNAKNIRGYGVPKYDSKPVIQPKPSTPGADIKVDYAKSKTASIAGTYAVTTNLYLRAGASTSKKAITVMPKGAKVNCYGYHTGSWYYVKYGKLTGFCSSKYLKKV